MATEATKAIASACNTFGWNLYKEMRNDADPTENLIFSPYSIYIALQMVYAGAEGATKKEMQEKMGLSAISGDTHAFMRQLQDHITPVGSKTFMTANGIFARTGKEFLPGFLAFLEDNYGALPKRLDFWSDPEGSREYINDWVAEQTEQIIKGLLPEGWIDHYTAMVLVNTIYFKGRWEQPFKTWDTKKDVFRVDNDNTVTVDVMNMEEHLLVVEREKYKLLVLKYLRDDHTKGKMRMALILPNEDVKLETVENLFLKNGTELTDARKALRLSLIHI